MGALWNVVIVGGGAIALLMCVPVFLQMRQHPKGLHILFFAEMWERFSYYGMRALLIFYLTQHFLFDDTFANSQYGAYTSLVYLLPLIGGYLADKYLGNRKAIAYGALLLVAGHFMMAVEGEPARQVLTYGDQRITFEVEGRGDTRRVYLPAGAERCELNPRTAIGGCSIAPNASGDLVFSNMPEGAGLPATMPATDYELEVEGRNPVILGIVYFALALIIMGVGFLKANISSIVGQLYTPGDPRRDPGFTLYYFGINFGSFWATALCGALGETYGWKYGFGLAGIGMLFGLLVFTRRRLLFFLSGPPQLPDHVGAPPDPVKLKARVLGPLSREHLIYIGGLLGVGVVWLLVQSPPAVILEPLGAFADSTLSVIGVSAAPHVHIGILLLIGSAIVLGYIGMFMFRECTAVEAQRMSLALILVAAATVFWTFFEQAGSSLNLFASRNTDLPSDGFMTITASQTQSFNAGFILIFAPIFSALWAFLGRRNLDPNPTLKFGLGLMQLGIGFYVLVWGAQFADENYRVPTIFLALLYLFHTTGELCLSPVGLSMITKLSVARVVSTMMAVWFLSSAWAQYVGGIIAGLAGTETVAGAALDPRSALESSTEVFETLGLIAVGIGVALSAASFWLKRLAHEDKQTLSSASATAHVQPDPAMPRPAKPVEGDV
jgi:POT family proton-dependent oligopeptide transporter